MDERESVPTLENARRNARYTYAERRIRKIADGDPPLTQQQRSKLALLLVDNKIAAAVDAAPPLPDDVAARLVELIRTTLPTPASEREVA